MITTNAAVPAGASSPASAGVRASAAPAARPSAPVQIVEDVAPAEWNAFVEQHSDATGYHRWEWRAVFERGLGHRCVYLAARRDGRVAGVLPLVDMRSRLFGRALSSLPYVNYGGVLATDTQAGSALVDAAADLARRRRLSYVVLRHRRQQFPTLPARNHKVTMLLPLPADAAKMWDALDRKVRNQVRKAEKSGLTTQSGGAELLDEFYAVFARNMRDLGTPVYGRSLFAEMLRAFPTDARVHLVRLSGATIAGALSYAYGRVVEVPSASSLREHRSLCPNHLMYWQIIQEAIAAGRTVFDFGRSTPNDGTYNFKEQWGAAAEPLWWEYRLVGTEEVPSADRQSASYQKKVAAWQRLPLPVATFLGPWIARSIP
jgi:FemAB-related protein (PEP-CTERM system-associated)